MIDQLLARNPKRRPESARQVRDALRRMAHGTLAIGAVPVKPPKRRSAAAPQRPAEPQADL